jgi:hypothetical protein
MWLFPNEDQGMAQTGTMQAGRQGAALEYLLNMRWYGASCNYLAMGLHGWKLKLMTHYLIFGSVSVWF